MTTTRTLEDHFDPTVGSAVGPGVHRSERFGTMAAGTGNVDAGLDAA